jgi:hypothetical protein
LGRLANSESAINIGGPSLGRFLIMERTAPTNLPRRGFFLEITELLNVENLARLLGSSRASVPPKDAGSPDAPQRSRASFDTLFPFRPRGRELLHQTREIRTLDALCACVLCLSPRPVPAPAPASPRGQEAHAAAPPSAWACAGARGGLVGSGKGVSILAKSPVPLDVFAAADDAVGKLLDLPPVSSRTSKLSALLWRT